MIYFEEVMSGLCSEAGGVYSGTTLVVQFSRTTSVDLNRHVYPWNRIEAYLHVTAESVLKNGIWMYVKCN